jgi:NAD(P)-dependent dehydrogenase (short-subunit alcohol dehydrogenase family)
MTDRDLTDSRVLITGAGRGIGAATAAKLAAAGARVALVDVEPDRVAGVADALGPAHLALVADVTDSAALDAAVAAAVARFGGLDVVVANAGIASWQTAERTDIEAFARTVDVNLTGVFRTVRAALPHILDSRGYVLVVASLASILPVPGGSAYGASKAGVEAFANALRLEVRRRGVAVGSCHMSVIRTDLVGDLAAESSTVDRLLNGPASRLVGARTAEQCADAFVDGIRHRARRVYVPRVGALLHWLRPLINSAAVDALLATAGRPLLDGLFDAVAATGRSAPDRALCRPAATGQD